ncbi:MAG: hypothetical protein IJW99_10070 [Clostridia bacterium]|nr:hypothetical protein [Clostridia bacterium]
MEILHKDREEAAAPRLRFWYFVREDGLGDALRRPPRNEGRRKRRTAGRRRTSGKGK